MLIGSDVSSTAVVVSAAFSRPNVRVCAGASTVGCVVSKIKNKFRTFCPLSEKMQNILIKLLFYALFFSPVLTIVAGCFRP